ncbi:MAG: sensor histidine kinase, partial [Phycisphaerae bacterium]
MKDLILHFFQAKAFPELASAVRARVGAVIGRWESAAREILPRADSLTHEQLRDSLPDTLERLAGALESTGPRPTAELLAESHEHGVDRADQAYNLADLLVEFDLLRPILMEEAALELGRDITLGEIIALNMGVDLAARRSVLTFVQRQRADLEAAARVQAKYLSFMSHDIRGGLNAILLSAEVLETELRDEPRFAQAMEDVDSIRRNILDTVAAMDRFLRAEQLRSGTVAAKRAPVDLRQLAAEVIMTARPQ